MIITVIITSNTCDNRLEEVACRLLFPPCPTEDLGIEICPETCSDVIIDCDILDYFAPLDCSVFTSEVPAGDDGLLCLSGE